MAHLTCRLTAKNRDQRRNPTLGNRVRATFLVTLDGAVQRGYNIHTQKITVIR